MWRRKARNSWWRWRFLHWVMTCPVAMSRGGEQGGGAVTDVIVGDPFDVAQPHRQHRGATTSCPHMAFGLLISPAGSAGACRVRVRPGALPSPYRPGDGPGSGLFTLAVPAPAVLPSGKSRISQVPWRSIPVTLRRSTTPDDPLRLAAGGASGAAPGHLTPKPSSLHRFRGLPRRFITCCLRFTTGVAARHARLASGRRAAPLPGGSRTRWTATERFQIMSSSSPGLTLAQ